MKKKRSHAKVAKKGLFKALPMGRPPKYNTEKELLEKISEYFTSLRLFALPSKAGLLVHLNISRPVYSEYRKKFPNAIRQADTTIEAAWIQQLSRPGATGSIFYLKNAFKDLYQDKHEQNVNVRHPTPLLEALEVKKNVVPNNKLDKKDI